MRPQAAALKALLDEPRLQVMPGCGDGMGAWLIEEAGFRTGFVSGSSVSAMRLAMPDMDLVSFNEMADAVESCIAAAPNVLWLADCDTGHVLQQIVGAKNLLSLREPEQRKSRTTVIDGMSTRKLRFAGTCRWRKPDSNCRSRSSRELYRRSGILSRATRQPGLRR